MIFRPAGRFLTIPFPPDPLAARFLAAVIRPPLLFFAMLFLSFLMFTCLPTLFDQFGSSHSSSPKPVIRSFEQDISTILGRKPIGLTASFNCRLLLRCHPRL